ncbi:MAG TPA: type II secretion system protein [Cellvibrionaceae bacterium]
MRVRGFTLIELLVVLAIVAFLAFATAPLASGWIRNAQLDKDFAGVQRALGTTKALAMRNAQGAAAEDPAATGFYPTAVLCRSDVNLVIFQRDIPNPNDLASCSRVGTSDKPVHRLGQDVAITFGATNLAFCGAQFDVRGSVRLCRGANCTTCDLTFDPRTDSGALKISVTGADATDDASKDQNQLIRAF